MRLLSWMVELKRLRSLLILGNSDVTVVLRRSVSASARPPPDTVLRYG